MEEFQYQKDRLFCEGVDILNIIQKVETPFYLYSYEKIIANFREIKDSFAFLSPLICYSLKANDSLTLCRILSEQGAGADIVSGGELYKALCAGFASHKIVFAGVGKGEKEIEEAIKEDIFMFNVESEGEWKLIDTIAERLDKEVRISIRVNPDVDPKTHRYITTGKKENKFGLDLSRAEELYKEIEKSRRVKPMGIHIHIGSQITTPYPYLQSLEKLLEFVKHLKEEGINLQYIDIGGGFGISYEDTKSALNIKELAKVIAPLIQKMEMKLILEPGRYIMGNAGVLVARVRYKKRMKSKTFIIVDAAMNDLIRPSLYSAYHRIKKLKEPKENFPQEIVDVVGPICESGDFFAQERLLPRIKEGEYLCIMDAGAYGFSMSSSYNARPQLAEIMVKDKRWWIIRERESYQDLVRKEVVPRELFPNFSFLQNNYLSFTKMQGSGNDFIIVDNRLQFLRDGRKFALKVCSRKKGIGADGVLILKESSKADFKVRIFNSDGSEAEMCGNGARCIARFAYLKGITGLRGSFETLAGIISYEIRDENKVKIKMSDPHNICLNINLSLGKESYQGHYLNTGVPHFILFVPDAEKACLKNLAPRIRYHSEFKPAGTNVDFVQINDNILRVRTYERGVEGETLACGTGAVGSAIISNLIYNLNSPVKVKMKGGELTVYFEKIEGEKFTNVFLEGEAEVVYEGNLGVRSSNFTQDIL